MCAPHSLTLSCQMRFFLLRARPLDHKHEHRSRMLIAGCRWLCLADRLQIGAVSIGRPYFYFLCSLGADAQSFVMTESGNKSGVGWFRRNRAPFRARRLKTKGVWDYHGFVSWAVCVWRIQAPWSKQNLRSLVRCWCGEKCRGTWPVALHLLRNGRSARTPNAKQQNVCAADQ